MLDIVLTVSDAGRSIAFYESVLPNPRDQPRPDDGGCRSPTGHRHRKGFSAKGGKFRSPDKGTAVRCDADIDLGAGPDAMMAADHAEALAACASEIRGPGAQLHCDPRIHARQVRKSGGHTLELVFKGRQSGR